MSKSRGYCKRPFVWKHTVNGLSETLPPSPGRMLRRGVCQLDLRPLTTCPHKWRMETGRLKDPGNIVGICHSVSNFRSIERLPNLLERYCSFGRRKVGQIRVATLSGVKQNCNRRLNVRYRSSKFPFLSIAYTYYVYNFFLHVYYSSFAPLRLTATSLCLGTTGLVDMDDDDG